MDQLCHFLRPQRPFAGPPTQAEPHTHPGSLRNSSGSKARIQNGSFPRLTTLDFRRSSWIIFADPVPQFGPPESHGRLPGPGACRTRVRMHQEARSVSTSPAHITRRLNSGECNNVSSPVCYTAACMCLKLMCFDYIAHFGSSARRALSEFHLKTLYCNT